MESTRNENTGQYVESVCPWECGTSRRSEIRALVDEIWPIIGQLQPGMVPSTMPETKIVEILMLRELWADLDETRVETTYLDDFDSDGLLAVPVRGRFGEYS